MQRHCDKISIELKNKITLCIICSQWFGDKLILNKYLDIELMDSMAACCTIIYIYIYNVFTIYYFVSAYTNI